MVDTRQIQARLIALGYDCGPSGADGIPGRYTRAAIIGLQTAKGLRPTGEADGETLKVLGLPVLSDSLPVLSWIEEARRNIGVAEIPGARTSPTILKMLEKIDAPFDEDETAWCGTFTGYVVATALPSEPMVSRPWGSINWLKFGVSLPKPMFGCVSVFWRGSPSSSLGHVGFLVGQDSQSYHVLGGNQSDAVNIARVSKDRVRPSGFRWPRTVAAPNAPLPTQALAGTLSQNEA